MQRCLIGLSFIASVALVSLAAPVRAQDRDEFDDAVDEMPDGSDDVTDDAPFFDDLEDAAARPSGEMLEPDMNPDVFNPPDDRNPLAPPQGQELPVNAASGAALRDLLQNNGAPRSPRFFRDLSYGLPQVPLTAVAVDPGDPEVILVGADGFIFKTDDGGESWRATLSFPRGLAITLNLTPLPQDEPFSDAVDLPDADADLSEEDFDNASDDGEAEVDDPTTFDDLDSAGTGGVDDVDPTDLNSGLPSGDFDVASVGLPAPVLPGVRRIAFVGKTSRTLYVATPRGLFKSTDAGESFTEIELDGGPNGNDVRDVAIDPMRPERIFVGTRAGLMVSEDGAKNFLRVPGGSQAPSTRVLAARDVEDDVVILGTERGLLRSRDGGVSFQQVLLQGVGPFTPVSALAYDERDQVTYAGTPLGLFASVRRAAVFEQRRSLTAEPIESVSVDPLRPGGVAVGVTGRGLVMSNDTGLTIVQLPEAFPAGDARDLARSGVDSDRILVATERGLFAHDEGTGIVGTLDQFRKLKAAYATDPTLAEAGNMALRYFGIHPAGYRDMAKRVRYMAYGPRIWAAYRYTSGRGARYVDEDVLTDNEIIDLYDLNEADQDIDLGFTTVSPPEGQFHSAFIGVSWDLDQLIYRNEEAQIRALQPQITRGQRRIVSRLQILYGVRRRLITEIVLDESEGDVQSVLRRSLKLQEATAQLDGLTGGGFSTLLDERGGQDHLYTLTARPAPRLGQGSKTMWERARDAATRFAGTPAARPSRRATTLQSRPATLRVGAETNESVQTGGAPVGDAFRSRGERQ